MTTDSRPVLPDDATDAEREAFAAAHRAEYLAAKTAREAARAARLLRILDDLDAAYERPLDDRRSDV